MYEKFYITSPMGTHYLNWPCKFEAGCGCLPSRQRLAAFVSFDLWVCLNFSQRLNFVLLLVLS